MFQSDFWSLPSCRRAFDKVSHFAAEGYGRVVPSHFMADRLLEVIRDFLERQDWSVHVADMARVDPVSAVASPLGGRPVLDELLSSAHDLSVVLIELPYGDQPRRAWEVFLKRFRSQRSMAADGLSLIALGPVDGAIEPHSSDNLWDWPNEFRPVDAQVWADLHAPPEWNEVYQSLGSSVAGNLLGWRFDLSCEFLRCQVKDLCDPIGWLRRRDEPASLDRWLFNGYAFDCPLHLLREGMVQELNDRLWKAQIAALFPWLENHRQKFLKKYRDSLWVNGHLESLGVTDVDQIELGAMFYQLRSQLSAHERDHLERLSRIRNALAHRQPSGNVDLQSALIPSRL